MTDQQYARLFSYKLTHDSGFAPNPFHGVLTLATCKPGIRRTKRPGDWVAGFSSLTLHKTAKVLGVGIDRDALIYVGQIIEVVPLGAYFDDPKYRKKIPPATDTGDPIKCAGDNMYRQTSLSPGGKPIYEQIFSVHHNHGNKATDEGGENVLIFGEFYYLGREGILPPPHLHIARPHGPTSYGYRTNNPIEIKKLIDWLRGEYPGGGKVGDPCMMSSAPKSCGPCG